MSDLDWQSHWQTVYATRNERDVSWFEENPSISFDLVRATGARATDAIIDVGGGTSRLVDMLLAIGHRAVTVLDISRSALAASKARLAEAAAKVTWIAADVRCWQPSERYDVWHDRAAFHFLTDPQDQRRYADRLLQGLRPRGHVIIGTFAPDGPERCSGLPVVRHDATSLGAVLGPSFELVEIRNHVHGTRPEDSSDFSSAGSDAEVDGLPIRFAAAAW